MIDLNKALFENPTQVQSIPARTGQINKIKIDKKLKELGFSVEDISLGKFDYIGEFTAKKQRDPNSDLYHSVGAFFRPNYERGLLIYSLIKKYDIESYLEVGYGRGYSCFCAAMAMEELGRGSVTTIDPALDEAQIQNLANVFPKEWFARIKFFKSTSDDYFEKNNEKFDMIYVDGDHRYEVVKRDWENSQKRFNKVILLDDYHLPGKNQKDIEVSSLVDSIEDDSKELVIMDRRIFLDDRGYSDDQIDYGQVLITK